MPGLKMPAASAAAVAALERLAPDAPDVTRRPMFGQPTMFVNGNMFLGTFGDQVFVRLSEADRRRAVTEEGMARFEPMTGRPMGEYVVLPAAVLRDPRRSRSWVAASLMYARGLRPKKKAPPRAGRKA